APYVRNGLTEVEVRGGRFTGGPASGESALVIEIERGLSDRISLAVLAEFEDHAGEARKLDAVAVEGVVYVGQIPGIGVDVGGYLEYEQRIHNESGVLEGKLLLAKRVGAFEGLVNIVAEQPLTDRDGEGATEFGYAAQATVRAARGLKLGAQAFGDLGTNRAFGGRQPHFIGPVANWEIRPTWLKGGELEFEAAYLVAAGSARDDTDGQVRLMVELERRF
ncbi:MAG TPA: hypothetical protein VFE03_15305, partial [Caulobacteraceae bacterium]|nr:hypothetical protein [Caulobacteraceae bacterium]